MLSPLEIETAEIINKGTQSKEINLCYLHWRLKPNIFLLGVDTPN